VYVQYTQLDLPTKTAMRMSDWKRTSLADHPCYDSPEQVVMFAVAGVVDVSAWPRLWRVSKHDFFVMASSFGATLVLGVLSGLGAAIAVSLGIFILNSSQPRIVELGRATGSVDYRALGTSIYFDTHVEQLSECTAQLDQSRGCNLLAVYGQIACLRIELN
jgi:MFS superfamily sulfate permease-like transporter